MLPPSPTPKKRRFLIPPFLSFNRHNQENGSSSELSVSQSFPNSSLSQVSGSVLTSHQEESHSLDSRPSYSNSIPHSSDPSPLFTNQPVTIKDLFQYTVSIEGLDDFILDQILSDSIVWHTVNAEARSMTNNMKEILSTCMTAHHSFFRRAKANSHIIVEGYARTGKTTLSKTIFPHMMSRLIVHKQKYPDPGNVTSFKRFRLFFFNCTLIDRSRTTFLEDICVGTLGMSQVPHIQQLVNKLKKHFEDKSVFNFIVVDEVQALLPSELAQLKLLLKDPTLNTNIFGIITGSTQAEVVRRIALVPSNCFAWSDARVRYTIPRCCSENQLQECHHWLKKEFPNVQLDDIDLIRIQNHFGTLHWSFLTQIYDSLANEKTFIKRQSLNVVLQDITNSLFEIYDRDVMQTILSMQHPNAIEHLLQGIFEKNFFDNHPCEREYFFVKDSNSQKFIFRDLIFSRYLRCNYEHSDGRIKYWKGEKSGKRIYMLLLPFIVASEQAKGNNFSKAVIKVLQKRIINEKAFFTLMPDRCERIDSFSGKNKTPEEKLRMFLIFIRNVLSHSHNQAAAIYEIIMELFCNNDEENFQSLVLDISPHVEI
ncbi:hypothetical protein C9374_006529 [Naegleria lovaniensis]|uniref:ORC1/DEAH AAA+ ATPase domain-containing protein n=1 Tax=Naegleria lovaniensis TaxID=51637 RepID=A0AA88GP90_NAELO|nr:uncharacterized protein C9374_006529 [Naegleria lovaniensis]KAG2381540.1 hypothetical protein C9374_006529 [Naegleria lovaniensis]